MRTILPLALCIVFFGAVAASSATQTQPEVHHHKATAQAHAKILRHEGLSRHASDCVKYGCVGY
jgi:hypothetical protein